MCSRQGCRQLQRREDSRISSSCSVPVIKKLHFSSCSDLVTKLQLFTEKKVRCTVVTKRGALVRSCLSKMLDLLCVLLTICHAM